MPKLKSHRGAAKRFRRTANGLKVRAAKRNHMLTKYSSKVKRHMRGQGVVGKSDSKAVNRMLDGS